MKLLTKVILGTIAVFGLTLNVQAADWKSAPGASCQSYYGSQATWTDKLANGIRNRISRTVLVNCSVPRDHVRETQTRPVGIWVYVAQRTTCVSRSNRPNGTALQANVTTAGPGWVSLPLTLNAHLGTYDVYCYLPRYGMLNTVLLQENGNTSFH